jgi:hypothetical protein
LSISCGVTANDSTLGNVIIQCDERASGIYQGLCMAESVIVAASHEPSVHQYLNEPSEVALWPKAGK